MPTHLVQPCYVAFGRAFDLGLYPELRVLSIGFLFPMASCSRVPLKKDLSFSVDFCKGS